MNNKGAFPTLWWIQHHRGIAHWSQWMLAHIFATITDITTWTTNKQRDVFLTVLEAENYKINTLVGLMLRKAMVIFQDGTLFLPLCRAQTPCPHMAKWRKKSTFLRPLIESLFPYVRADLTWSLTPSRPWLLILLSWSLNFNLDLEKIQESKPYHSSVVVLILLKCSTNSS